MYLARASAPPRYLARASVQTEGWGQAYPKTSLRRAWKVSDNGLSRSASSSFAFLLVSRVPPRRPRAIVFVRVVALRVSANSHARRATGSKIACATSGNSLAFAGSTEARENASSGRPCVAAAISCVLPVLSAAC